VRGAASRGQSAKDRIERLYAFGLAADHLAVARLQPPLSLSEIKSLRTNAEIEPLFRTVRDLSIDRNLVMGPDRGYALTGPAVAVPRFKVDPIYTDLRTEPRCVALLSGCLFWQGLMRGLQGRFCFDGLKPGPIGPPPSAACGP
jgi:hypothetical protein